MFFSLLLATFFVAALVSGIVVAVFRKPIGLILDSIVQDSLAAAWRRYITFAAFVVGISGGVRIYALERYLDPASEQSPQLFLTPERWTLEIYRSIIETLQSIAWMYLVVFVFTLIAYVIVKGRETRQNRQQRGQDSKSETVG